MLVHVRQRRWVVEAVAPPPLRGDASIVDLACIDDDAQGQPLSVLWEVEPDARVLEGDPWATVGAKGFDDPDVFSAYLNTRRWNSVTSTDPTLFQAPFRAGIRIDAYQLEPLRKALALPRVNLFIADDVGLGKTIEAGLVARELLLRRRVDSIVVVAPPSMLTQWQEELEVRFGLSFVIVDRLYYSAARRERGYGVNPWTTHSRFLISNRLLVDEAYVSGLRDWLGELRPQSLLILDEAHHAAPSSGAKYAIDSQITRAVRDLAGRFEHRLFLSATPHNGHSNSFSSLLEILDPNRFCRGVKVRPRDLEAVMVRRLKDDIRELEGGFPKRNVVQVDIEKLPEQAPELLLSAKLDEYREAREARLAGESPAIQRRARLVLITLQQRLLSSIEAFARTVGVHRRSMERAAREGAGGAMAARDAGRILQPVGPDDERAEADEAKVAEQMDAAVEAATVASMGEKSRITGFTKELALLAELQELADKYRDVDDARIKALLAWIDKDLCPGALGNQKAKSAAWTRRRVIIFTEWEDTRRYVERRLRAALARTDRAEERIAVYTGSTPQKDRDALKHAFNADPEKSPIRILIATDAAREGLNLQRHCHDLYHFDLPWNPGRIEQRNGRIDRKLQPQKEVYCRYFFYHQRPEDRVLRALVQKTERIRSELGSLAQVLESRVATHLQDGIRRATVARQEKAIEDTSDTAATAAARAELEDVEAKAERLARVRRQIGELQSALARSKRRAGVEPDQVRQAFNIGLSLGNAKPLKPLSKANSEHPDLYVLPVEGTPLASDATWVPALDSLRTRPEPDQDLRAWRREAPLRPVAFEDTGELGDGAVQLHIEHRLIRRLLGRFVSKGMLEHDLSRACLTVGPDAIPRVVLIGRLSLYGAGGARLHEELIEVAARWIDPADRRGRGLQLYGREAEQRTLELLEEALRETRHRVHDQVLKRLTAGARQDVRELTTHLESRAEDAMADARKKLVERARRESESMRGLLNDQAKRIRETDKRWDDRQLSLGFSVVEDAQLRRDRSHWQRRLERLALDLEREPARIAESYAVKASRVEPVGVVWLWPASG
jgi:superfamily II DNA or RNA helicase